VSKLSNLRPNGRTAFYETLDMKMILYGVKMFLNIVLGAFADFGAEMLWLLTGTIRRQSETSFVYVNQDGSVRELSVGEQEYLTRQFQPFDGARPYIKSRYWSWDNWGSRSGYLKRYRVPWRISIQRVRPDYDAVIKDLPEDILGTHRASGELIVRNDDGSITCTPNPNISRKEHWERARKYQLEAQARREALAKVRE
jgi:hypothetical protein